MHEGNVPNAEILSWATNSMGELEGDSHSMYFGKPYISTYYNPNGFDNSTNPSVAYGQIAIGNDKFYAGKSVFIKGFRVTLMFTDNMTEPTAEDPEEDATNLKSTMGQHDGQEGPEYLRVFMLQSKGDHGHESADFTTAQVNSFFSYPSEYYRHGKNEEQHKMEQEDEDGNTYFVTDTWDVPNLEDLYLSYSQTSLACKWKSDAPAKKSHDTGWKKYVCGKGYALGNWGYDPGTTNEWHGL